MIKLNLLLKSLLLGVRSIKLNSSHKNALNAEIKKLLSKNIISVSNHEPSGFISNIFPDNSLRMILNLKCLNESVEFIHFKIDSIHSVLHNITPSCFMASQDLKSTYYSSADST